MDLKTIQEEWHEDAKIDQTELGNNAADASNLHAKYLDYLVKARFNVKKAENKLLEEKQLLTKYFKGLMTKDELEEYGWPQYQGPKPLKTELQEMIEANNDYIKLSNQHHYCRVTEDYLEHVIKELSNRNWNMKLCLQWIQWTNGDK